MEEQLELNLGQNYRVAVREMGGGKLIGEINALSVEEAIDSTRSTVLGARVVLACITNEGEANDEEDQTA